MTKTERCGTRSEKQQVIKTGSIRKTGMQSKMKTYKELRGIQTMSALPLCNKGFINLVTAKR